LIIFGVIKKGEIGILASETVLLYKSRNCENSDN